LRIGCVSKMRWSGAGSPSRVRSPVSRRSSACSSVAHRDDQARVPSPSAGIELHAPSARFRTRGAHLGAEAEARAQLVPLCVAAQVAQHQVVARVVGVVRRHRVAREAREVARGDEVARLVHRGAGDVDVPDAAEVALTLEAVEGDTERGEPAGGAHSPRPRPHQAEAPVPLGPALHGSRRRLHRAPSQAADEYR